MKYIFPQNAGIDIAEVGRFRKLPYKTNKNFYNKIFTENEIKYCIDKADPYQHFAARFAAKEAVIKALGKKIGDVRKIEIINERDGRPQVETKNLLRRRIGLWPKKPKTKILLSLSHVKEYAVAVAFVYS